MIVPPVLTVRDVSVRDPARQEPLVHRVSFALRAGERCALIGASGAGKSLLAAALLRVLPPPLVADGEVHINGVDLLAVSPPELRRLRGLSLLLLPQSAGAALSPAVTLIRQVRRAAARRSPDHVNRRAGAALDQARLPRQVWELYPFELSGGMRQRGLLALAFALEPKVLIADEPSTGLDPVTRHEVFDGIDLLVGRTGSTLLLITHDLRAAGVLCRDGVLLDRGQLVWRGALRALGQPDAPGAARELVDAARQLSS